MSHAIILLLGYYVLRSCSTIYVLNILPPYCFHFALRVDYMLQTNELDRYILISKQYEFCLITYMIIQLMTPELNR